VKKEILSAIITIIILSIAWLFFNRGQSHLSFYLLDFPYFLIFTSMIFMIGIPYVSQGLRYGTKAALSKTVIYPILLLVLYYSFVSIHDQPVMEGASLLLPYLMLFPVLALYHQAQNYKYVSWWDLIVLILFLWPVTLIELPEKSHLPLQGIGFDSVYRMVIILILVYAFVVVRRLQGVGFWVDPTWHKLWTTFWVWLLYIGFVVIIGMSMGIVTFEGFSIGSIPDFEKIVIRFFSIYLHTALFEELFFRGLLQNLLSKKIRQSSNPLLFWIVGSLIMLTLALATGVLMKDDLFWLPLIITLLVFICAYLFSNLFAGFRHHYLALAISSVLFGLVHFHAGSVVYVGFAILAGWAYGYVYWKTRNVFYAALIHALVNISPMLLGFELLK